MPPFPPSGSDSSRPRMHREASPIPSRSARRQRISTSSSRPSASCSIDPDEEEMTTLFQGAGFKGAGVDARFFGETHALHRAAPLQFGSSNLPSEAGAKTRTRLARSGFDEAMPRELCRAISSFDVDGIPDARGVHRIATAEDIEAAGTEDQVPSESYWVGFTDGPIVVHVRSCRDPQDLCPRSKPRRSQARITTGLQAGTTASGRIAPSGAGGTAARRPRCWRRCWRPGRVGRTWGRRRTAGCPRPQRRGTCSPGARRSGRAA